MTVQRLLKAGADVNYQNKVMTVNVELPCKYYFGHPVDPSVYKKLQMVSITVHSQMELFMWIHTRKNGILSTENYSLL